MGFGLGWQDTGIDIVSLFGDEYSTNKKEVYNQFKLKSEKELLKYLKQFITISEEPITPYKYKDGYYNKKAHYINGQKVNRDVYKYIKNWLEKD